MQMRFRQKLLNIRHPLRGYAGWLLLLSVLLITGCHTANYYRQAAAGQYEIFAKQESIPALLALEDGSTWPGGNMAYDTGTSMATPFVAGAVALLRSVIPSATTAQIRAALYNSAAHSTEYISVSQGRMDLTTALSELHQITGH